MYNLYNKAAGNPASQLIGLPAGSNPFSSTPDPTKSLGKGDYDPSVSQPWQSNDGGRANVAALYQQKQLQNKTPQQSATNNDAPISQFGTGPTMQYMGQVQSKEGLLGSLLKTAAIASTT
jgi:hypothetical protein